MIRVFYLHPRPEGGFYPQEQSIPVADMAQFVLRQRPGVGYGLEGVRVIRTEPIDTSYENGAADYYSIYGTVGEF